MTARKKFGRPVVFEQEEDLAPGPIRKITMSREGGALDGAYAAFSSRDELRLDAYRSQRRDIISSGVKAFFALLFFWVAVAFIASTFIFAR